MKLKVNELFVVLFAFSFGFCFGCVFAYTVAFDNARRLDTSIDVIKNIIGANYYHLLEAIEVNYKCSETNSKMIRELEMTLSEYEIS